MTQPTHIRRAPIEPPRIVALCAGYGGLETAIRAGIGGQVAAFAENDPHAAAVFAAHHPGIPNLGDITTVDWNQVRDLYAPDVVGAGFPCRNISNAGRRDGINGQWSRVWKNVAQAVGVLRPRLVFLENVAAIRSRGGAWTSSPQTWPRSGMTRGGHVYELVTPKSGPRTRATAGSQLLIPLMPTPTTADGTGGPGTSPNRKGGMNLRTAVTKLPPPTT